MYGLWLSLKISKLSVPRLVNKLKGISRVYLPILDVTKVFTKDCNVSLNMHKGRKKFKYLF